MNVQEYEGNKCRICLEDNADVNWSDFLYDYSDISYKDCYYKYTQLEYFDVDNFSTMLCRNCSNGLEYIDAFISKAIETHVMLQEKMCTDMMKDDNIQYEETNFETILVEETETKPEVQSDSTCDDSVKDFLTIPAEINTRDTSETCTTPLSQPRKHHKRNPIKTRRKKFKDELSVYEPRLNDKQSSKKLEQSICCSICSKVLSSKYKAITHEKTHIKNRERNETCVECGLKFFSKEILKSHMLTHLKNREKPHKCEFCDKAFYNKSGLNIHSRIHLGQMISCSLCTKEFYRQIDLDRHMVSHSAVRINSGIKTKTKCFVRCRDCGESIRSTNFKSHNAKHMNEPLFKCTICDKEFFFRRSCVKHLKKYHKKKSEDVNNFVIAYKTNRISHLFLQQNTDIQVKEE